MLNHLKLEWNFVWAEFSLVLNKVQEILYLSCFSNC